MSRTVVNSLTNTVVVYRWDEIPNDLRVDEAFLRSRHGAVMPDGEEWVQKRLRHINEDLNLDERGCAAAVRFTPNEKIYRPCLRWPLEGEEFCHNHGGAKRNQRYCEYRPWYSPLRCGAPVPGQSAVICRKHWEKWPRRKRYRLSR